MPNSKSDSNNFSDVIINLKLHSSSHTIGSYSHGHAHHSSNASSNDAADLTQHEMKNSAYTYPTHQKSKFKTIKIFVASNKNGT
jgi:hypothetical protein